MEKLHCTPETILNNPQVLSWLEEDFISPLKEVGFEFKGYAHVYDGEEGGTHILKFKETQVGSIIGNSRQADHITMVKICTQDDDSQPSATYRYYLGTLWLYIPYTI
jgi:hypothetical protein